MPLAVTYMRGGAVEAAKKAHQKLFLHFRGTDTPIPQWNELPRSLRWEMVGEAEAAISRAFSSNVNDGVNRIFVPNSENT